MKVYALLFRYAAREWLETLARDIAYAPDTIGTERAGHKLCT